MIFEDYILKILKNQLLIMSKKVYIYALTALVFIGVRTVNAQNPERFFSKSDLMTVGSYYYPEQWPRSQWERDIKKMAETGFEFTHFGEFAWGYIEPQDGKFDFKWLDEAVEIAHKNGVKVIMCTSTATPPAWLSEKHPDILMVNEEGTTMQHGSRQHISWSSPVYRKYVARMAEALAKHYANDKRIWGWQLDNEPSHYGQVDHSPAARVSFQKWLKNKYKSIDSLNKTWGNAFWSVRYNTFEQIRTPNPKELIAQPNPCSIRF